MDPEPTPRDRARTRVDDGDRETVVAHLNDHFVRGSLDADERDARVGQALAARTRGDLDALVDDLGAPTSAPVPATVDPAVPPARAALGALWTLCALGLTTVVVLSVLVLLAAALLG